MLELFFPYFSKKEVKCPVFANKIKKYVDKKDKACEKSIVILNFPKTNKKRLKQNCNEYAHAIFLLCTFNFFKRSTRRTGSWTRATPTGPARRTLETTPMSKTLPVILR